MLVNFDAVLLVKLFALTHFRFWVGEIDPDSQEEVCCPWSKYLSDMLSLASDFLGAAKPKLLNFTHTRTDKRMDPLSMHLHNSRTEKNCLTCKKIHHTIFRQVFLTPHCIVVYFINNFISCIKTYRKLKFKCGGV